MYAIYQRLHCHINVEIVNIYWHMKPIVYLSLSIGILHDKTMQTCCGNTLIAVPVNDWQHSVVSNQRCCGGVRIYDVTMEMCCAEVVQRRHIFHRYGMSTW